MWGRVDHCWRPLPFAEGVYGHNISGSNAILHCGHWEGQWYQYPIARWLRVNVNWIRSKVNFIRFVWDKDQSLWSLLYVGTGLLQNTARNYQELGKQGCTVFRSLYWYWRHHCWSADIPRNSESYQEGKGGCDRGDPKSTQHGTWTNTRQHSKADFWESGKPEYGQRVSCLEVKD